MKLIRIFTIRVIYKSGASQEFDTLEFHFSRQGGAKEISYNVIGSTMPLWFNLDEVAAIWQVGTRRKLIWGK